MAAGLMLVFFVLQLALGLIFVVWIWIARARSTEEGPAGTREKLLWIAAISVTLGVAFDFYFMLARSSSVIQGRFLALSSFSLSCFAATLAIFGKGRGRLATMIASCALAISWLPLVLP